MWDALSRPRVRDAGIAVVLSVALVLEFAVQPGDVGWRSYALGLATTAPLALRSRVPLTASFTAQAVFAVAPLVASTPETFSQALSVFVIATWTAALAPATWRGAVAAGVVSAALLALEGLLGNYGPVGAVLANVVYVLLVWGVAAAVRVNLDRSRRVVRDADLLRAESAGRAEQAVLEERARIARELHDVVAHSLAVVVLRARGAAHETEGARDEVREALHDIEVIAGSALGDMRRLLTLVSGSEDGSAAQPPLAPQPTLSDLPDLVAQVRRAGLSAVLREEGVEQAITPGVALASYRVVQESLTNVLRHTASAQAEVVLRWHPDRVSVSVSDTGPGDPHPGSGQGLVGLRERVELFGGTLVAGGIGDGGFRVVADIPLGPKEAP